MAEKKIIIKRENLVDMSDACELAHAYTVEECERKGITLDAPEDENGELHYTEEAQDIFDKHFDIITNTLKI